MKRWFARLPIHQKLVAMALVVTASALMLATAGLVALDVWRYRATALDDTAALADVIAENTVAAVTFNDARAATETLATARVRPTILRACLYLPEGELFAGFARQPEVACSAVQPTSVGWRVITGTAAVRRSGRVIAIVYVERDLAELGSRIAVAALSGFGMLLVAAAVAYMLAQRLHRSVSTPITQLAAAARAIQPRAEGMMLPDVQAGEDEIGDLLGAFMEMLRRVREANARLVESNDRLLRQEAEREDLLTREREANRLKDEFLAAVSHELRTPLNAILGWVQILMTTRTDERTREKALTRISRNAKVQARVIDDLVDVSRIVTGKVQLSIDSVDLRDVVNGAVDDVRAVAETKGLALHVDVPPERCLVDGDRLRLQQVVWNLLSNAIAFTPPAGAVFLRLRCGRDGLELCVKDTGSGIPGSFLPHVFDRFRQADGSITREHGGLGLGLAIVKELTELHGGTVTAESPGLNLGASFTIRLPGTMNTDSDEVVALREAVEPAPKLTGIRILAVDDSADALEILAAVLEACGANVRVAAGGELALREWDREPADVLICDLAMPQIDGFEVLRRIRARDAAHGHVTAAIALTAHASADYQARTKDAGFDGHLSKPYDVGDLVRSITAALAGSGRLR